MPNAVVGLYARQADKAGILGLVALERVMNFGLGMVDSRHGTKSISIGAGFAFIQSPVKNAAANAPVRSVMVDLLEKTKYIERGVLNG